MQDLIWVRRMLLVVLLLLLARGRRLLLRLLLLGVLGGGLPVQLEGLQLSSVVTDFNHENERDEK